jgi:protein ImuB
VVRSSRSRSGQYGLHLQRLARGEVVRELIPAELPMSFQESAELEEAIELLEPLAFVFNRLLEQLMERSMDRSLATDHIEIELSLEVHPGREVHFRNFSVSKHQAFRLS